MDVRLQARASLLHTFPTLMSCQSITFTDECAVYLSTKSQNVYIRAKQNPHLFEVAQHPPHLMMWAGVISELIIGPYYFDESVTGKSYVELLSYWLIPEHDNVGLLNSVILQQDGAPAHYAAEVRAFQSNQFPLWTGCHGPLIRPPRSTELTKCENWLWSFVKEQLNTIFMHSATESKG
jgi:hypothetical protein